MNSFTLLYLFWFVLNTLIFYMSGYPQKFIGYLGNLPFIDAPFSKFVEYSDKIYLISGQNVIYYDITEYFLALLVPLFATYFYKALKPKQLKYQKGRTV